MPIRRLELSSTRGPRQPALQHCVEMHLGCKVKVNWEELQYLLWHGQMYVPAWQRQSDKCPFQFQVAQPNGKSPRNWKNSCLRRCSTAKLRLFVLWSQTRISHLHHYSPDITTGETAWRLWLQVKHHHYFMNNVFLGGGGWRIFRPHLFPLLLQVVSSSQGCSNETQME